MQRSELLRIRRVRSQKDGKEERAEENARKESGTLLEEPESPKGPEMDSRTRHSQSSPVSPRLHTDLGDGRLLFWRN